MQLFDWKNDKTWPYKIIGNNNVETFRSLYDKIKLYHACRPKDTTSYYVEGIKILTSDWLHLYLIKLVYETSGFVITAEQILDTAEGITRATDSNKIFLCVDDADLIKSGSNHYAMYGSEYVLQLIDKLQNRGYPVDRSDLLKIGKPTIFEIDYPVKNIDDMQILALVSEINKYINNEEQSYEVDFTFVFRETIHPSFIIKHHHPDLII